MLTSRMVTIAAMLACACVINSAPAQSAATSTATPGLGQWGAVSLPFSPYAIDDSGVIVGQQNGKAVRYANGVATLLPLLPGTGFTYGAIDIASSGAILGKTDISWVPALYWTPASVVVAIPQPIAGYFIPAAMNTSNIVVGTAEDIMYAYKWTQAGGFVQLHPPPAFDMYAFATDVNDAGYIAGYAYNRNTLTGTAVLWTPTQHATVLQGGSGIRSRPHINKYGDVAALDRSLRALVWSLNGTVRVVGPIPDAQSIDGLSDMGRLIGTSQSNGVKKGWTYYDGGTMPLNPPLAQPGDYVQPTGVNTCGDIVGLHYRQNGTVVGGVLFTRATIITIFRCDKQIVVKQ